MSSYTRRLPVYLLLDCSESMAGRAFEAMKSGLTTMIGELRRDPMALETAAMSLITFASKAQQLVPLTDLIKFQPPRIPMGSGTALGAALQLLEQSMAREVRNTTAEQKGDYKPVVFILTDGTPTDQWEKAADRIKKSVSGKRANVIAVACGPDADLDKLRHITEAVVVMDSTKETSFAKFFQWVSASVSTSSQAIEHAGEGGVSLPGLPEDCMELAGKNERREPPRPDRYIFIHARCSQNGSFYVVRYMKQEGQKAGLLRPGNVTYKGVPAHPVDDFDFDEGSQGQGLNVAASALLDLPACPYCGNPTMCTCGCGQMFCSPAFTGAKTFTCPWCKATNTFGGAVQDVRRGRG